MFGTLMWPVLILFTVDFIFDSNKFLKTFYTVIFSCKMMFIMNEPGLFIFILQKYVKY